MFPYRRFAFSKKFILCKEVNEKSREKLQFFLTKGNTLMVKTFHGEKRIND